MHNIPPEYEGECADEQREDQKAKLLQLGLTANPDQKIGRFLYFSYLKERFILALNAITFPSSSSFTSNSLTSAILRSLSDSDAVAIAFLAVSSQSLGDDATTSMVK